MNKFRFYTDVHFIKGNEEQQLVGFKMSECMFFSLGFVYIWTGTNEFRSINFLTLSP